jgi:predicted MFS family arabinose efflux permease
MSTEADRLPVSPFDRWQALFMGLYMSVVGYAVLAGIPVISSAWSALLGFSEPQVGRVAGADLGGLSVGAVAAAFLVARMNRRWIVLASIAVAVAANIACIQFDGYRETLILRFVAGIGSGLFTGVAVATLGGRSHPAKAYNYLLFVFAFVQAGEMYVLPQLSMNQIYWVFAASFVLVIPVLHWLPAYADPEPEEHVEDAAAGESLRPVARGINVPRIVPWLFLAAMALTYVNIGAYWTYIELATVDAAIDSTWVSSVLVWVSFFAVLGCFIATLISDRFGMGRPLLLTLLCQALAVGMLVSGLDAPRFLISVYAFNFLWIFVDVYQMGSVASVDQSGRFASLMPAAQGLGQIVGPNLAASMLAYGNGYSSVFMLCACASLLAFVVYAVAYYRMRGVVVSAPGMAV